MSNWHPPSWNALTTAQRRNLRVLVSLGQRTPRTAREQQSLETLVTHGLATRHDNIYAPTVKGREWASHLG